MDTVNAKKCCAAPSRGSGFCCVQAELDALRDAVDHVIRTLDSEVTGPLVLDDEGNIREVARRTAVVLKAVRSLSAA